MVGYQMRKKNAIITKEVYSLPSFPQLRKENRFAEKIKVVSLAVVACSAISYAAGLALNLFALPFFSSFWIFSSEITRLLVAGMVAFLGVEILLVCVSLARKWGVFRRISRSENLEDDFEYFGTSS